MNEEKDTLETAEVTEVAEAPAAESSEPVEIIGIRFKEAGKTYYFAPNGLTAKVGDYVIAETARGIEMGKELALQINYVLLLLRVVSVQVE